jgi:pSer/pThr/pTyr-binding forkhead associated (FHA) protein
MTRLSIGRAKGSDIAIADVTVSRRHAELTVAIDGKMTLSDLASTSGTFLFVDGRWTRIARVDVTEGDRIMLGTHETTVTELFSLAGQNASRRKRRFERNPETGEIVESEG